MGGNALAGHTERKDVEEFTELTSKVMDILWSLFPDVTINPTSHHANKKSFGDLDIVMCTENLPSSWWDTILETFKPTAYSGDSGVHSFAFNRLQVDIITTSREAYDFHMFHYSFGDLSNIIGQIAYKMGFKMGEEGLVKVIRDKNESEKIGEMLVTRDVPSALQFLGYDCHRYAAKGFYELEDIFEFVSSTPYFHRHLFKLENHNSKSRKKLEKRPNYLKFLEWLEAHPELDKWEWPWYVQAPHVEARVVDHDMWLTQAYQQFHDLKEKVDAAYVRHEEHKAFRAIWSGERIMQQTELSGKGLGKFMQWCATHRYVSEPDSRGWTFEAWVMQVGQGRIDEFVNRVYPEYLELLKKHQQ